MMSIELQKQLKFLVEKLPESLDHYLVSTPRSLLAWIQMVGRRYDFNFFFPLCFCLMTFFAIEAVMSEQTVITLNDFILYSLSNL